MIAGGDTYVIGAGGHAKVLISVLLTLGYKVPAVLDDDEKKWDGELLGVRVIGPIDRLHDLMPAKVLIGIGDNATRRTVADKFKDADWPTVIHPGAYVHQSVKLGPGTVIFAGAVVQPDSVIGAHCIINTAASIDHDCDVGDYVHIAPGAHLAGGVRLGEGAFAGLGTVFVPGVEIGPWTVVGAGGVVIRDLPARVVAVGVPSKILRAG